MGGQPIIPYGRQTVDQADIDAITAVMGGDWLTQGPSVSEFEAAVADKVGARHAVAFSSGTAGLHACAYVAGWQAGNDVVTSPLTFMASANCVRYVGARPVLADIDDATFNLDESQIPESAMGAVPVHFAGLPVDLATWSFDGVIVEDAAHALGASTPDGPVGNCAHSDMCCFSFHPVKPITTAEGGVVTTNSDEYADALRTFRSHGIVREPEQGGWYYEISEVGYNYRLTDLQAALGTSQLAKLDRFIDRRNELAARYRELLTDLDLVLPPAAPDGFVHGYHLFAVQVPDRRRVYDTLREAGIYTQVHYVPVHHHPVSVDTGCTPDDLPVVNRVYEGLLSLPMFPRLTNNDQDRVVEALRGCVAAR